MHHATMHAYLPNELLIDIIKFLFEQPIHSRTRGSSGALEVKPPWSRIHAVVSTSRTLRAIGLRLWFARLRVRSEFNWEYISSIPGIYNWVRVISYHNVTSILIPSIDPTKFPALECVSMRMLNADRPMGIINRLPRSVKYLELWKFDTMVHDRLFSAIASRLPDLRELRLHGMGEVDKFGLGTLVDSADVLGQSMASSLRKMQKLEVLAVDVYLTPSTVLLRHASCPSGQSLVSCDTCKQEFSDETRENETEVSLLIAGALKSLKRVEWCSCFCRKRRSALFVQREGDQEGASLVTVSRRNDDKL